MFFMVEHLLAFGVVVYNLARQPVRTLIGFAQRYFRPRIQVDYRITRSLVCRRFVFPVFECATASSLQTTCVQSCVFIRAHGLNTTLRILCRQGFCSRSLFFGALSVILVQHRILSGNCCSWKFMINLLHYLFSGQELSEDSYLLDSYSFIVL